MLFKRLRYFIWSIGFLASFTLPSLQVAAETHSIVFPVIGGATFRNDFGDPRSGGRTHKGNDIFGKKMQPLVAVADGIVRFTSYPEPNYGYIISIEDADGYQYWYLHVNNDAPGTDDGHGGGMFAYATDIFHGNPVRAGQLIGWMGDSGNAESTPPHLHFEIHRPDGEVINPYPTLQGARKINSPVVGPTIPDEILPFGQSTIGSSIAYGDVDQSNPGLEIVTGAGPGGGPQIRVFNQGGRLLSQFFSHDAGFRGGIDVATGDVNGDGVDEVIIGTGKGGDPQVKIFDAKGIPLSQFFAYDGKFKGGLTVASADMDANGVDEIITGAGPGGGPHVKVFDAQGNRMKMFFAYDEKFRGGIDVAAYRGTGESPAIIVTGAGVGGGPHVRIFDAQGNRIAQFFAFDEKFRGGVKVAIGNILDGNTAPEIIAVPAANGGPSIRVFDLSGQLAAFYDAFEPWWRGSYDTAAGDGALAIASGKGGRRASVRPILIEQTEVPTPPEADFTGYDFVP